jgi:post-segregation antitoxin (ccd killing protein)
VRQGEVATTSISGTVMLECVGRAKDRAVEVDRLVQAAADAATATK